MRPAWDGRGLLERLEPEGCIHPQRAGSGSTTGGSQTARLSALHNHNMGVEGANCVVTGGSGLTGRRLVEMLAEKGAARVVSFDIAPKPADAMEHPAIEYQQVCTTFAGVEVVVGRCRSMVEARNAIESRG